LKNFSRNDLSFSLCGLNCALCAMKLGGYCPGCGGGSGNQSCAIARCSLEHGIRDYCASCLEYPCRKYDGITEADSFITHQHQLQDMARMKAIGPEAYHAELARRSQLLARLLSACNDGRRKTLFSLAANLLDLADLEQAMRQIESQLAKEMTQKEKAAIAAECLEAAAAGEGIVLKLRRRSREEE
jgi:hypothetical protein